MIAFLILPVIFLTFRFWFEVGPISSGDMGFFYPEQIKQYLNLPFAWEAFREAGLGGVSFLHLGVYFYNLPMGFLGQFLDYGLIERLIWFWPILIIGLFSPFLLVRELNLFPSRFYPLACLIFLLNTYFLMIIGGGQLTVALAYIMIPLVLSLFLKVSRETNPGNIIFFSFSFAFLIAWDFRFVYLLGIIIGLYLLYFLPETVKNFRKYFKIFFVVGCFILGFHAFWILPFLFNYQNPIASFTSAYKTSGAVQFLSFADFSHAFSLLHPNWPENIFGKTYFMQWEFLILPLLAYSSLFFVNNRHSGKRLAIRREAHPVRDLIGTGQARMTEKNEAIILFFVFLGLIGAFLAKGSNEPFGGVYLWMFAHIPGFVMFRDPTKFYTLIALSYSILIPYSVWQIYDWLNSKLKTPAFAKTMAGKQNYFPNLFLILTTLCLMLLIRPAWMGQLGGTFKFNEVPREYLELKNFIANQPEFFRTFWIPTKQRFTFYTDQHPAIDGAEFLKVASASSILNQLKEKNALLQLSMAGVKYVILPFDSEEEIFIKDRKYDDQQRQITEKELAKISWLKRIQFGESNNQNKTIVYETPKFNDRFWLENTTALHRTVVKQDQIAWKMINPTKYEVKIENLKTPSTLIFSENFDPRWEIKINDRVISSEKVYGRLNSFKIESLGNQEFFIEFRPQKYIFLGLILTGLTILMTIKILCGRIYHNE